MKETVGGVTFVKLFQNVGGRPRGCGAVKFKDCTKKTFKIIKQIDFREMSLNFSEGLDSQGGHRESQPARGFDRATGMKRLPPGIFKATGSPSYDNSNLETDEGVDNLFL